MNKLNLFLPIFLIGLGGYGTLSMILPTPKFKAGDCTSYYIEPGEFLAEKLIGIEKIIKVGKKVYLIKKRNTTYERDVYYYQKENVLVNCETGERL